MILSVHATFGAAVASLVPSHPVAGFVLGFASHFILDAIPHSKEYSLISVEPDPNKEPQLADTIYRKINLLRDVFVVLLDAAVGFCLAFMFFFNPIHPFIFFIGSFAALIPDGLTFLFLILKHKSLGHFYNFHVNFIHSEFSLKINKVVGVALQFFTISVLIGILMIAKYYYFIS